MEDKIFALLCSLGIFLLGYICKLKARTWLNPSCIFCLFWFMYSFVPLLFLFDVDVNAYAVVYILFGCIAFSIPTFFFDWKRFKNFSILQNRTLDMCFDYSKLFFAFVVMAIFSSIVSVLDVLKQGFTIIEVFTDVMSVANSYMAARYSGDVAGGLLSSISTVLNYTSVMVGGFIINKYVGRKLLLIFVLSFMPSLLIMVLQAVKGTLFLCIVMFFFASRIAAALENDFRLLPDKGIRYISLSLLVFVPAIIASFFARGIYEEDSSKAIQTLLMGLNSYSFGHLYAFSDWFSFYTGSAAYVMHYEVDTRFYLGFYTFMPLAELLGITKVVPPGVYSEYFYVPGILQSNIFTFFRGGVLDFGMLGFLLVLFVLGVFSSFSFYRILVGRLSCFSISFYITLTGFIYTSFIISLFIWKSGYASFLLFALVLLATKKSYSRYYV